MGPDFVCIGAQKAGTTWLYDNLFNHPQIHLPPVKEIHYFDAVCANEKLLGIEANLAVGVVEKFSPLMDQFSISRLKWLRRFYYEQRTTGWYQGLFENESHIQGDITPAYSTLDDRGVDFALRVLKSDCKIFVILRNPIERMWSGVKMAYRWKEESITELPFSKIRRDMQAPTNMLRSDYLNVVRRWKQRFGSQFKIFLYEDLVDDPEKFLGKISDFIGVSAHVDINVIRKESNSDKKKVEMPASFYDAAQAYFSSQLSGIDEYVPGVEAMWGLK